MNLPDEGLAKAGPLSFPGPRRGIIHREFQGSDGGSKMGSPWLDIASAQARLVRPFPVKRLSDALFYVEQDAGSLHETLQRALIDPPRMASDFVALLDRVEALLIDLQARCEDVLPILALMVDQAPADERRGLDALVAIFRTIKESDLEAPLDVAA